MQPQRTPHSGASQQQQQQQQQQQREQQHREQQQQQARERHHHQQQQAAQEHAQAQRRASHQAAAAAAAQSQQQTPQIPPPPPPLSQHPGQIPQQLGGISGQHPRALQPQLMSHDRRRDVYVIDPAIQQHPQHPGFPIPQHVPSGLPAEGQGMPLPVPGGGMMPGPSGGMMMPPQLHHPPPQMPLGRPLGQQALPPMPNISFDTIAPLPTSADIKPPPSPSEPTLTLLPEDQRAIGHGARRPFQPRRRSRACDACRTRKTKCDTPDNGPCASCVAASLVCKFSEGGDERRRAGPTRKARELENENRELKAQIRRAQQEIQNLAAGYQAAMANPDMRFNPPGQYPAPGMMGQGYPGMPPGPPMGMQQGLPPTRDFNSMGIGGNTGMGMSEDMMPDQFQRRQSTATSESSDLTIRGHGGDGQYGGQYYGSTSAPTFATWFKAYMEWLGYSRSSGPSFMQELPEIFTKPLRGSETEYQFPLLSDYPHIIFRQGPTYDLRGFLPDKDMSERLKAAYWETIQIHTPALHWLKLEVRWQRAYNEPLWETDRTAVRELFCVVMMVMAVASQYLQGMEMPDPNSGQKALRNGWKYFELARKYHGLNNPVYTVGDCIIMSLMSLYLDNASLPSPAWMMTGAMARVCQDMGLHRNNPRLPSAERESRKRLFWGSYILDQKIALVLGRPPVFRNSEIRIDLPEIVENDDSVGCPPVTDEGWDGNLRVLNTFRANILVCQSFESVTNVHITNSGTNDDIQRLLNIDQQIARGWEMFPVDMTDARNMEQLEVPLLRPLINAQHARLSLFRWFCDFSKALQPTFRRYCLQRSVAIARFTAHLLNRAAGSQNFDEEFATRTNDLVHIHAFRAAAILLLQYNVKDQSIMPVSANELNVCVRALKVAANRHPAAARYYDLYETFAQNFRYAASSPSEQSSPGPQHGQLGMGPGSGDDSNASNQRNYPPAPTPGGSTLAVPAQGAGGGTPSSLFSPPPLDPASTSAAAAGGQASGSTPADTQGTAQQQTPAGDSIDWSTLRDMMELDAGFGSMMSANPLQPSSAAPSAGEDLGVGPGEGGQGRGMPQMGQMPVGGMGGQGMPVSVPGVPGQGAGAGEWGGM